MNTTKIGNDFKELFVVQNLHSRSFLAFCLTDSNMLDGTSVATTLEKAKNRSIR